MNNVYTSESFNPATGQRLDWFVFFNIGQEAFEGQEETTGMKFYAPTLEEAQAAIREMSKKVFNNAH